MKVKLLFLVVFLLFSGCGKQEINTNNLQSSDVNPTKNNKEISEITATQTPVPTILPTATPTEIPDEICPVIDGLEDIYLYAGENVSYKKGITVTDNKDETVSLEIDASDVDLDTPGEYIVTYKATDSSGNCTVETITVFVQEMNQIELEVNRLADELLQELITENMSKWDTCYTLWNWCRTQIKYAYSAGDRSSIYAGAYEGLHDRSGDCYAYYATFTLLLQKCGIDTIEVRRIDGKSNHWWNLVNLGDGWYHCDSSPRKAGHTYLCFMQTDAQIQEYTEFYKEKPNYYVFDESLYPERETTVVFDGNLN